MTNIYVVGYPKTGTTWLSRLLGDILNSPVGAIYKPATIKAIATEGQNRPGKHYIGQGHPVPTDKGDSLTVGHLYLNLNYLTDEKIILITRDPRDVCVSAMYHWGMDNIHQAIKCVGEGEWPTTHGGGFVKFYEQWLKDSKQYDVLISYERLIQESLSGLLRFILNKCQVDYDESRVEAAIERQSFANRKKWTEQHGDNLNYGKEYQLNFLRKGIVGDWQNHFDQKAIEMSEEYFGELE